MCETLLYANQIFKDDRYKLMAENVGSFRIEQYLTSGVSWPCGIKGAETPGLMLGLRKYMSFALTLVISTHQIL